MGFFDFLKRPDMGQELERFAQTPGALLLDVRTEEEYAGGHIPGSRNVPLGTLHQAERQAGYAHVTDLGGICNYHGKVVK